MFKFNFFKKQKIHSAEEITKILEYSVLNKSKTPLNYVLSIIFKNNIIDSNHTKSFITLLSEENWHDFEEDIVTLLEEIKAPESVDILYHTAINIPDYDEMRGLAKKCMWALRAINTPEAIEKLKLLEKLDDEIIKENAEFHLERILKKN